MALKLKDKIFYELSNSKNIINDFQKIGYHYIPENSTIELFGNEILEKKKPMIKILPVIILKPLGDKELYNIRTIKRKYTVISGVIHNSEDIEIENENIREININSEIILSLFKKLIQYNKSLQKM
jgi:hypothetical protein